MHDSDGLRMDHFSAARGRRAGEVNRSACVFCEAGRGHFRHGIGEAVGRLHARCIRCGRGGGFAARDPTRSLCDLCLGRVGLRGLRRCIRRGRRRNIDRSQRRRRSHHALPRCACCRRRHHHRTRPARLRLPRHLRERARAGREFGEVRFVEEATVRHRLRQRARECRRVRALARDGLQQRRLAPHRPRRGLQVGQHRADHARGQRQAGVDRRRRAAGGRRSHLATGRARGHQPVQRRARRQAHVVRRLRHGHRRTGRAHRGLRPQAEQVERRRQARGPQCIDQSGESQHGHGGVVLSVRVSARGRRPCPGSSGG
ncbi:hypothetical protein D9M72_175290 [compost metagenome]